MIFYSLGGKRARPSRRPGSPEAGKPGSRDPWIPGSREAGKPGSREAGKPGSRIQILASPNEPKPDLGFPNEPKAKSWRFTKGFHKRGRRSSPSGGGGVPQMERRSPQEGRRGSPNGAAESPRGAAGVPPPPPPPPAPPLLSRSDVFWYSEGT